MPALAASIIDFLLRSTVGPAGRDAGNRVTLEGLTTSPRDDGALEIRARKFEAASLRAASGPLTLEVGQLVVHELVALVRLETGRPRLDSLEAPAPNSPG